MLELKLISSPDREMLGEHIFYKNYLSIGLKHGDLLLADPQLLDHHLKLQVDMQMLYIFKNDLLPHIHVNGKIVTYPKIIRIKDKITIGQSTLEVKNFSYTAHEKKEEIFKSTMRFLLEDDKNLEMRKAMDYLENDLKKLV